MRKVAISVGLFALSWAVLAWLGNPLFATILLTLLSVHEAGHLAFMWKYGVPLKGLYFIPLLGAFIVPGDRIRSRPVGVAVSLGGPLFGLASALAALGVYALWPGPATASAAYIAALINLFNMFPVFPLDGGQALAYALDDGSRSHEAVAKTMWNAYFLGLGLLLILIDAYLIVGLLAYYGYQGIQSYLAEIGRREDRDRVRAALAEAFDVAPEAVLEAVEAPLVRLRRNEEPAFDASLLQASSNLFQAEGLRRIPWCVPEDVDISDDAADDWTDALSARLASGASTAYGYAIASEAAKAVSPHRVTPFGAPRLLTRDVDLDPYTPLEKYASTLRRFLAEDATPPAAPADGRRSRVMYAALAAALAATTLLSGYVSGWSYTGLL